MSSKGARQGPHCRSSELKVKEVIMPVKNDLEGAKPTENVSKYEKDFEYKHNISFSSLKLGDHETNTFYELVALKKPPIEDFVLGTKKKKYKKKKEKYYPMNNSTFCDLFLETNETFHPKDEPVNDSSKETFEEKRKLEWKIKYYEDLMLQQQENNSRRQRRLEKQTLEKQENLAETWLGFIQRREELKKKKLEENVLTVSPPRRKRQYHSSPIDISLIRKKYWNTETGEQASKKSPKPEKRRGEEKGQKPLPVVLEGLKDEFYEKLVFVDDSDGISD